MKQSIKNNFSRCFWPTAGVQEYSRVLQDNPGGPADCAASSLSSQLSSIKKNQQNRADTILNSRTSLRLKLNFSCRKLLTKFSARKLLPSCNQNCFCPLFWFLKKMAVWDNAWSIVNLLLWQLAISHSSLKCMTVCSLEKTPQCLQKWIANPGTGNYASHRGSSEYHINLSWGYLIFLHNVLWGGEYLRNVPAHAGYFFLWLSIENLSYLSRWHYHRFKRGKDAY